MSKRARRTENGRVTATLLQENVLVRSKNKSLDAQTTEDFTLDLTDTVHGYYRVRWVSIPNTIFTIDSHNDTLHYNTSASLTLTHGNYSGPEIAAELETKITAVGGALANVLVTYDTSTLRINFDDSVKTPGDTIIIINSGVNSVAPTLGTPIALVEDGAAAQIFTILVATTGTTALPNVVDLASPTCIGITIKQANNIGFVTGGMRKWTDPISGDVKSSRRNFSATLIVPFAISRGVYAFDTHESNEQYIRFHHSTRRLDIKVISIDDGENVDLNGGHWQLMMEKVY